MALLETRGVTVTFGGLHANDAIDLTVDRGSVVGLIGPNGAGKTSFVDAVTGFVTASSGSVIFDGVDVTRAGAAARARAGIARTFQSLELFEDLCVRDNLAVAAHRHRWFSLALDLLAPRRATGHDDAHLAAVLDSVGIAGLADAMPAELSHGQRKLVGVARALAARPRLLLLDEPAAGLDSSETRELGDRIRSFGERGLGVLLIDHDMDLVMTVCDTVYVLDFGRVIAHGAPSEVRRDAAVVAAYLGDGSGSVRLESTDE